MKIRIALTALPLLLILFATAQPASSLYSGPPVFHGAKVVGNYPGTDFLFTVPATGERPIAFFSSGLPKGLNLEAGTGIIRGRVNEPGEYRVKIIAGNAVGKTEQELTLVIGSQLCLTPPMGWNSWNVFTKYIDEKMLLEMADAMVSSGMRDMGYQYINIDDFWHAVSRDADGNPVADTAKFPHGIKYIADYLHARGLKLGIYSDAGTKTCGGCFGGYGFEEMDAKKYAEWGIDLLKYDFCHVPLSKKEALARYQKMGNALKASGRSIVYSICNWGFFAPWKWAAGTGGHYWRTTPDIFDIWKGGNPWTLSVMTILKRQNKWPQYAGPGHWNDPDMLLVGNYGKGHATSREGKYAGLTDVEYASHMSLWALMAAPLLSSCDLRTMNGPTKNILMNPTLLAINQDELGAQAVRISKKGGVWVYKKPLKNGGVTVAFFNPTGQNKSVKFISSNYTPITTPAITSARPSAPNNTTITEGANVQLTPHETVVLVLTEKKP